MGDVVIRGTTPGPCGCCAGPAVVLSCRKRGGTATLIGFAEFTSPSTPPKRYLISTATGDYAVCDWTLPGCAGTQHSANRGSLSGTCSYDAVTGARTNAAANHVFNGSTCPASNPQITLGACADSPLFNFSGNFKFVDTQTTRDIVPLGVICTLTSNAGYVISNEDTEDNAIVRLLNANDWSDWLIVPDECSEQDCCLAQYEERVSSFNFAYQEAQWKVASSGLLPSHLYTVNVEIWRAVYGSGMYSHYATLTGTAVSSPTGALEVTGDVPNAIGFQTYVASASISP